MKRAMLMLPALLLGSVGQANADIINGSFESGLSSWTASPESYVSATSSASPLRVPGPGDSNPWTAVDGNLFAYMMANPRAGTYTLLSQSFTASIGNVLSFSAFFDAGDDHFANDDGYIKLKSSSGDITLFSKSVAQLGDYGGTNWTAVSYTFNSAGTYQIEAGVRNVYDANLPSALGLDAVNLSSNSSAGGEVAPAPSSVILLGLGGFVFAGLVMRSRRLPMAPAC